LIARVACEKKAQDILVLDMSKLLIIVDCFVIISGNTTRQVKTLSDTIQEELAKRKVKPIGKEGETAAKWILLDYGDVVVHIFTKEEREYYQLERLWKDAPEVDWEENIESKEGKAE